MMKTNRFKDGVDVKQIVRYGLFALGTALISCMAYRIGAQDGVCVTQQFVENNLDPESYKKLDDTYKKHVR